MKLFGRPEPPLPAPLAIKGEDRPTSSVAANGGDGILLGEGVYWSVGSLPNPHICVIGASGSGKTQTLKAIAHGLGQQGTTQLIIIDFHGDQALGGEAHYPLHMASPYGVNPLTLNLDPQGGGPELAAIACTRSLRQALRLGPNQEGLLLTLLQACYQQQGLTQEEPATWTREPPNFAHLRQQLQARAEDPLVPCADSARLLLKLAATFAYGVFSRPAIPLAAPIVRLDLSKLPPALGAIAAEALASQVMAQHRLAGEHPAAAPRTMLFVDEAKEMTNSPALDRIVADGRKYGLGLVLASQSERHLSKEVIANSATKIVLPVDQTEVRKVASKFRFPEAKLATLTPLTALCRLGTHAAYVKVLPYYQRLTPPEEIG